MEDKLWMTPQLYEECVLAKARCKMVEKLVQTALNEKDHYVSTEYLAIVLGLEKESEKNETN